MEIFKDYLLQAKRIVGKCKEREELKKHMLSLSHLGTSFFHSHYQKTVDFAKQRNDLLGLVTDPTEFKDTLQAMEMLFAKKPKKPVMNSVPKIKEPQLKHNKDASDASYRPPVAPRVEELPIAVENGAIVCNFEYACILLALAQKAAGNTSRHMPQPAPVQEDHKVPAPEKKREIKLERRKRVDRFGEVVIDRRVQLDSLRYQFEPEWNLTTIPLQGLVKESKLLSRSLSKGIFLNPNFDKRRRRVPGTDVEANSGAAVWEHLRVQRQ